MDLKQTPFLEIPIIKTDIRKQHNEDGSIVLKSAIPLENRPHRMNGTSRALGN